MPVTLFGPFLELLHSQILSPVAHLLLSSAHGGKDGNLVRVDLGELNALVLFTGNGEGRGHVY